MSNQPENIKAMVMMSGQCDWGNCMYCGWGKAEYDKDIDRLKKGFENNLKGCNDKIDTIKIFTSGSFLDDEQFPPEFQNYVLDELSKSDKINHLITEALPKFITDEKLEEMKRDNLKITIAIGLEVASDEQRVKIGKGFTNKEYEEAVAKLRKHGFGSRAYILVNPPNIDDVQEALDEVVEYAMDKVDSMALINTYPHNKSHLFHMWISRNWSPLPIDEFYKVTEKWKDNPKVELDDSNFAFMPKFPKEKQEKIKGAGEEQLLHPYYKVWEDYFLMFYEPPSDKDILMFVPCSFRKPYTNSKTHKAIDSGLKDVKSKARIHKIVLSNPGVIPVEYSNHYPFNSYDWPEWEETPEIKEKLIEVTYERVKKYLEKHKDHYTKFAVFMKPTSECRQGAEKACEELGIELIDCLPPGTWDDASLGKGLTDEIALTEMQIKLNESMKA